MDWYYYIALALIISQVLFLIQMHRNYYYALVKYKKKRYWQEKRVILIVPCKGLDATFEENITSFFNQDYDDYQLWFVVAEEQDPAYSKLCKLKDQLSQTSRARDVRILIAGKIDEQKKCSQKIHNLLYCYNKIGDDVEILAFADSDVCIRSDWLKHIVWPLREHRHGATSGYRWFIPAKFNLASLALSAVNAKIVQLLGNTPFNQAWGGSMAIHVDVFRKVGLDKIWPKTLSDDLSLTYAVKRAGMKVGFVPACLAASYESTTWRELFEFGRRQFLITRVSKPGTWLFGLFSSIYSVLGLWAGAGLAIYAAIIGDKNLIVYIAVPAIFFAGQMTRAIQRQDEAKKLLTYEIRDATKERQAMNAACAADIFLSWLWSLLILALIISSAVGRTITWRGIRYKLLGPTETIIEKH